MLKAGGAYVPLDPGYPPERLAFMLADARRRGAAHGRAPARRACPRTRRATRVLDRGGPGARREPTPPTSRAAHAPGNLAYVIYTSGSTGRPKGVMRASTAASANRLPGEGEALRG